MSSCIFASQLLIFRSLSIASQEPLTRSPSEETDAHTSSADGDKDILVMKRLTTMLVVLMWSLEVIDASTRGIPAPCRAPNTLGDHTDVYNNGYLVFDFVHGV